MPLALAGDVEDKVELANRLAREGFYEDSILFYDKALNLNPSSWRAYLGRAQALKKMGQHKLAASDLKRVKELNPKLKLGKDLALVETKENQKDARPTQTAMARGAAQDDIAKQTKSEAEKQARSKEAQLKAEAARRAVSQAEAAKRAEALRQKIEAAKQEQAKTAAANSESKQAARQAQAKAELARQTLSRVEADKQVQLNAEAARKAAVQFKAEVAKQARLKAEAERQAHLKAEAAKQAQLKAEAEKQAQLKAEAVKQAQLKAEAEKQAQLKAEAAKQAQLKAEAEKQALLKAEAEKQAQIKLAVAKAETLKQEKLKAEALQQEKLKQEALREAGLKAEASRQAQLKGDLNKHARLTAESQAKLAEADIREQLKLEALGGHVASSSRNKVELATASPGEAIRLPNKTEKHSPSDDSAKMTSSTVESSAASAPGNVNPFLPTIKAPVWLLAITGMTFIALIVTAGYCLAAASAASMESTKVRLSKLRKNT